MTLTKSQEKATVIPETLNCEPENDKLFNEVVDIMISSKKPLIVHNGYLDLMHVRFSLDIRSIIDLFPTYLRLGVITRITYIPCFLISMITNICLPIHQYSITMPTVDLPAFLNALLAWKTYISSNCLKLKPLRNNKKNLSNSRYLKNSRNTIWTA